ncbi:UNVERIFIED_CONTAM: hypothetical protein FKN15_016197 [Acipenser sinensis]
MCLLRSKDTLNFLILTKVNSSRSNASMNLWLFCKPFEDATLLIQGSNIVSASYVISSIIGLRTFLSSFNAKYNAQLVSALKASLEKRLSPYEQMPFYKLAALLDPRFKAAWCPEQLLTATVLLQQESARFAPQPSHPATAQDPPPKRSK